jgi:alkyl hydroperoxide reductase subunit AhpC
MANTDPMPRGARTRWGFPSTASGATPPARGDWKLHFPLPADFEPKGAVSRRFGVYGRREGRSGRARFVVDGGGTIRRSSLSPEGVNPGADGVLRAPAALDPKETTHA